MSNGYLYILKSVKDKKTYTGSTSDLPRRLKEHHNGKVIATKNRRPLVLLHSETFIDLSSARARERYYKTHAGRKALSKILNIGV